MRKVAFMDKTLTCMLVTMVLLFFPGFPIINSFVVDALANPSVSESVGAPIIRLIPLLWLVGDLVGMPILMARHVISNR